MWLWVGIAVGAILLGLLFYWAFVITEGAYLGAKFVAWTYDLTARRYDQIKQFRPVDDAWLLARPMLEALDGVDSPLVLDVATGTGRMPLALLRRPLFQGTVIGLDLSRRMLQEAAANLEAYPERVLLLWQDAAELPLPDESVDAVSCLEALEFMPSPQRILDEMSRVLRPGGMLLVTNRRNWEGRLMPGKAFTDERLQAMLESTGLVQVEFRPWQVYYDLIWARKGGEPSRLGRGAGDPLRHLRCPSCGHAPLDREPAALRCPSCRRRYPIREGIVDLARPER